MTRTKMKLIMIVVLLLALGACRSAPDDTLAPLPTDGPESTASAPRAATEAYPSRPTATPRDADYPAPAAPPTLAPATAYPDDSTFWILRPLGQQCEGPATFDYENIDEATMALEDAGVEVLASEAVSMAVCTACNCPTSEHFRVQIRARDLGVTQDLGWIRE